MVPRQWATDTAAVHRVAAGRRARLAARVTDTDAEAAARIEWTLATRRATEAIVRAGTKLEAKVRRCPGVGRQAYVARDTIIGLIWSASRIGRALFKRTSLRHAGHGDAGGHGADAGSDPCALLAAPVAVAPLADRIAAYRRHDG